MLPLHAAGRHGAAKPLADRRRPTVAARCVSSYTSSLGALLRARSGLAARPPKVFAVGLAHTSGQAPLPAVSDELRSVSTNLSGVRLLVGAGATTEAVLAALARHSWAHFACHAEQDFDHPSASALRLADGRLSVLDLASGLSAATRSPAGGSEVGADLAYLSACRTAAGGRGLPDEAIHLTAALQVAGFRHVIGSQWAVADRVAAQIADDVYARLAAGPEPDASGAAYALDQALARIRQEHPDRPDLWAALIHTGP
jgi:CHAT domain-containing protein